ncbi:hypothetical protein SARC_02584 [Sphaeroforma arctica JP610]|uniref:PHD-type domain-containing protein n=1 Tax=Sphaeroforma arctica JP610 TaxID=667725 RepID=A0A0L0G8K1_9EUKA|nr:hypothetical protein SARC_02584 [Sphaeroforma arctica JP610]KNC85206.1 hypothetical protein SARC_02584 [Sphaeroforma arctica JP610]|eukprot:XP_014159108.1 hypothetical protein SARC_02584 [Sphaeroforma arctica JP610]
MLRKHLQMAGSSVCGISTTKPDGAAAAIQPPNDQQDGTVQADITTDKVPAQTGDSALPVSEDEESGDDDDDDEIEGDDNESEVEDTIYGIKFRTIAEIGETIPNWLPPFPTIVEKPAEQATVDVSSIEKASTKTSTEGDATEGAEAGAVSVRTRQGGDGLEGRDVFHDDPFSNEPSLGTIGAGQTNGGLAEMQQQRMMNNMGSHHTTNQPNNGAVEVLSFSDDEDFQRRISYDGPIRSAVETGNNRLGGNGIGAPGRYSGGWQGQGTSNLLLVPTTPPELSGEDSEELSASSDEENVDPVINVGVKQSVWDSEKQGRGDRPPSGRNRRADSGSGGVHKGENGHAGTGSFRRRSVTAKDSSFGQSETGDDDDNWSDGSDAPLRPKKLAVGDSKRGIKDKPLGDKEKGWEGLPAVQNTSQMDSTPTLEGHIQPVHKTRSPEIPAASTVRKDGGSAVVHLTRIKSDPDDVAYAVGDSPAGTKKGGKLGVGGVSGKDRKHRNRDKDKERDKDRDKDRDRGRSMSGVSTNDKSAKSKRSGSPTKTGSRSKDKDKRLPIRPDGSDAIALSGTSNKSKDIKEKKSSPRPSLNRKIKTTPAPSPSPSSAVVSGKQAMVEDGAEDKDLLRVHVRSTHENGKDEGKRGRKVSPHRREKRLSRSPSKSPLRSNAGGSPIPPHSPSKKDRDTNTKRREKKVSHRENKYKSDSVITLNVKEPGNDDGKESSGERSRDRSRDRSREKSRDKDRDKDRADKRHRDRDKERGVKPGLASPQKEGTEGHKSPSVTIGVPKFFSSSRDSEAGDKAKKRDKPAKEKSSFGAALSAAVGGTTSPQVHQKDMYKGPTKIRLKTGSRGPDGEMDKHEDRDRDKEKDKSRESGKEKEREKDRDGLSLKVKLVGKAGGESPRKRPLSPADAGPLKVKLGSKMGVESPKKRPLSPPEPSKRQEESRASETSSQAPKKMKLAVGGGKSERSAEHSIKLKRSDGGDGKSSGSSPNRKRKHTDHGNETSELSLKRGGSLSPNPVGTHRKKHRSRSPSPRPDSSSRLSNKASRPHHSPKIDNVRESPKIPSTSPRPVSGETTRDKNSGTRHKVSKGGSSGVSGSSKSIVKDGKIRIRPSSRTLERVAGKEPSADREKGRDREKDKDKDKDSKDRNKDKHRDKYKDAISSPPVTMETGSETPSLRGRSRRSSATYVTLPVEKSGTGDGKARTSTSDIPESKSSKAKNSKDKDRDRVSVSAKSPTAMERQPSIPGSGSRPLFVVGAKKVVLKTSEPTKDKDKDKDRDVSAGDLSAHGRDRDSKATKAASKRDKGSKHSTVAAKEEKARSDDPAPTSGGGFDNDDEENMTFADLIIAPRGEEKDKSKKKKKEKKDKKDKKRKRERTYSRSVSPHASPTFDDNPPTAKHLSIKLKISRPDAKLEVPVAAPEPPPLPPIDIAYNCVKCPAVDTHDMICCEACDSWFHFHCVGLTQTEVNSIENYYCKSCKKKGKHKKKK